MPLTPIASRRASTEREPLTSGSRPGGIHGEPSNSTARSVPTARASWLRSRPVPENASFAGSVSDASMPSRSSLPFTRAEKRYVRSSGSRQRPETSPRSPSGSVPRRNTFPVTRPAGSSMTTGSTSMRQRVMLRSPRTLSACRRWPFLSVTPARRTTASGATMLSHAGRKWISVSGCGPRSLMRTSTRPTLPSAIVSFPRSRPKNAGVPLMSSASTRTAA